MEIFISNLIQIITGIGLLYYGLKKYNTSLAISFFVPGLYGLYITKLFEIYPEYSWGALIGFTLLTLFFARALTYLFAFFIISFVQIYLIHTAGLYETVRGPFAIVFLVIAAVLVWFIRIHLKTLIIGFMGGLTLSFGILSIVLSVIFSGNSNEILMAILTSDTRYLAESSVILSILPVLWILVCSIGGIVFQYLYILPRQNTTTSEETPNTDLKKD